MPSSSARRAVRGGARRTGRGSSGILLSALLLALAAAGCARVSPRAPNSDVAAPATTTGSDAPPQPSEDAPPLDPSEQITPEELATIPDPVPEAGAAVLPAAPSGIWRVQVFASSSRAEAERVAVEASAALGAPYRLDEESGLFKVRLGRFGTEAEAEPLRERAIAAGYYGAFRIQISGSSSDAIPAK